MARILSSGFQGFGRILEREFKGMTGRLQMELKGFCRGCCRRNFKEWQGDCGVCVCGERGGVRECTCECETESGASDIQL